MPEMLKEDKVTSIINLLTGIILLITTIILNILFRPLITFYIVSFFMLIVGSSVFFPPKGKKISDNCYVMIYHIDHFIVTLNGRRIWIKGERLRGKPDQIIYRETSPKWLPPHENEPILENEYENILKAVLKFLEKQKKQGVIEQIGQERKPPTKEFLLRRFPQYKKDGYKVEEQPDGSIKVSFPPKPLWLKILYKIILIAIPVLILILILIILSK